MARAQGDLEAHNTKVRQLERDMYSVAEMFRDLNQMVKDQDIVVGNSFHLFPPCHWCHEWYVCVMDGIADITSAISASNRDAKTAMDELVKAERKAASTRQKVGCLPGCHWKRKPLLPLIVICALTTIELFLCIVNGIGFVVNRIICSRTMVIIRWTSSCYRYTCAHSTAYYCLPLIWYFNFNFV
jgi:hypothetical protein